MQAGRKDRKPGDLKVKAGRTDIAVKKTEGPSHFSEVTGRYGGPKRGPKGAVRQKGPEGSPEGTSRQEGSEGGQP